MSYNSSRANKATADALSKIKWSPQQGRKTYSKGDVKLVDSITLLASNKRLGGVRSTWALNSSGTSKRMDRSIGYLLHGPFCGDQEVYFALAGTPDIIKQLLHINAAKLADYCQLTQDEVDNRIDQFVDDYIYTYDNTIGTSRQAEFNNERERAAPLKQGTSTKSKQKQKPSSFPLEKLYIYDLAMRNGHTAFVSKQPKSKKAPVTTKTSTGLSVVRSNTLANKIARLVNSDELGNKVIVITPNMNKEGTKGTNIKTLQSLINANGGQLPAGYAVNSENMPPFVADDVNDYIRAIQIAWPKSGVTNFQDQINEVAANLGQNLPNSLAEAVPVPKLIPASQAQGNKNRGPPTTSGRQQGFNSLQPVYGRKQ